MGLWRWRWVLGHCTALFDDLGTFSGALCGFIPHATSITDQTVLEKHAGRSSTNGRKDGMSNIYLDTHSTAGTYRECSMYAVLMIYTIANVKGGVGKTTTAVYLTAVSAHHTPNHSN